MKYLLLGAMVCKHEPRGKLNQVWWTPDTIGRHTWVFTLWRKCMKLTWFQLEENVPLSTEGIPEIWIWKYCSSVVTTVSNGLQKGS